MITHITINSVILTAKITKQLLKLPELSETTIQIKQAPNDHVVIVCSLEFENIDSIGLKRKIKEITNATSVNYTFVEKK